MSKSKFNTSTINDISETFSYGVVYVYSIPDEAHKGRLKIGSATINSLAPTLTEVEHAAHERIKKQTKTADIAYSLVHSELALTNDGKYFSDHQVHDVLKRSGYNRKPESVRNPHSEWFEVTLDVAKKAIQAVKEGRQALTTIEKTITSNQFEFRPNQLNAIEQTTKAIKKKRKHFLWNAKMRFGKTSAAMQVAKVNEMKKVLIVTHRPSVSVDWFDDFNKVFADTQYQYASKTKGEIISNLLKGDKPFVYFASLQDLRLSKRVVEDGTAGSLAKGFDKNDEVFDTTWDMIIIDEAHEGTQSKLGDSALTKIPTNFILQLSGTPFNILHKHEEEDVYTWDYVMEQEEKLNWDVYHPGVPNPYAELPSLSIFTYDINTFESQIGKLGTNFHDSLDGAFKFHEFFRVHKDEQGNDLAEFVHESMVRKFLDLLTDNKLSTKFPYSTEEYRNFNKHSLWLLPNRVKVIEAMERLLKDHPIFGSNQFGVVNISGNARDDEEDKDAKDRVIRAVNNNEYTITLTGQRLTTGASIPEWTAIFMMSDTSSATTYLQTAFRCQTPAKIEGKIKTQGYVFDFAPDRTLKLVAEAIELNHKSGKTNSPEQREAMKEFLNFCPIIAAEGGKMQEYDVANMLAQLKKAIIERVSRNGFDDPKLYNDELLKLDEVDISMFNELKEIVGNSTSEKINEIEINSLGMNELKTQQAEDAERKKKKKEELSEEEKEALLKLKEAREQKKSAISILRAVSIRMPMLVYGAKVSIKDEITLQKFLDLVDEESWQEFMPAGLTKEKFRGFIKYYDEDVFKGVTHSIRAKAFDCDDLLPTERIVAIADIFSTFKNPDKETVLTPWNVVNFQITETFGGYDFRGGVIERTGKPEWKKSILNSELWSEDNVKILEINSKSGLYPLLAAYNIYNRLLTKSKKPEDTIAKELWRKVLMDNIYVLCKSPMAKSITQRTLAGYMHTQTNIIYINDLVKKLQQKNSYTSYNTTKEIYEKFNLKDEQMKFSAVIGNPPYQEQTIGTSDDPIYHLFMEEAYKLSDKVCLITPARFLFNAGKTPKPWNKKMHEDKHLKVVFYEQNSAKVFPNTDIKGGVAITYRDSNIDFGAIGTFTPYPELSTIIAKVSQNTHSTLDKIITGQGTYTFTKLAHKENPKISSILSKSHQFDVGTGVLGTLDKILFFNEKPKKDKNMYVKVLGVVKNKRIYKWIKADYMKLASDFKMYKVVLPKANGSGMLGEVLSSPMVLEPQVAYTQTFIGIGSFKTEAEAKAVLKYISSKFARTMLGVLKVTQDNPRDKWAKVPMQDFTKLSDIDWSKSISEIDKQLYKKYGFSKNEIDFIEKQVKATP